MSAISQSPAAHQSLYRRYRPSCFAELIGQPHVVAALCNSVRDDRVGHAYLFSGPRGTGKTSTARILAKAINCENPSDGEPCGECESCLAFAAGTSYDLHELDAASNNKVEDIRDLISKVSFGTPGRRKVYVLDEVHMLTTGAENALLKTLEEPPAHVCFVMCTTEPHKVAATVRSRAQHLLFELVTADELAEHVRWVAEDAELSLSEDDLDYAVRSGNGSVRDTLSALDQVVSAEGKPDDDDLTEEFVAALASHDTGKMLAAADAAIRSGKEPRVIGEEIVRALRSAFLCSVGADLSHLLPQEQAQAQARAAQLPTAAITKTFEELGQALVRMRQSPDPRIDLELAFFRLSKKPDAAPASPPNGTPNSAGQRGETRRAETKNEPAKQNKPESTNYADREAPSNAGIEEPSTPPPPMERNPSRVQRAREQLREELRSAGSRSTPSSLARPPNSSAETSSTGTNPPPPAPASPAPTLGAIRRRRAAEQSEAAPQSGQPTTQAETSHSNPLKSTAEAVGISEETMTLVEEYFPDAKAVELPESMRQMTPTDAERASSQQSARADSASADSTQPSGPESTTESTESLPSGPLPSRDEVTVAWGNEIFDALSPPLRRRFSVARFLESRGDAVRLAMSAAAVSSVTAEQHQEVEARLAEHFGYRVAVLLTEDDHSTPAPPDPEALISKKAANASPSVAEDSIFANGAETANETGAASRAESVNGVGAASEADPAEDRLSKAISYDAAMTIEAEALEAPKEIAPNIPQDALFN